MKFLKSIIIFVAVVSSTSIFISAEATAGCTLRQLAAMDAEIMPDGRFVVRAKIMEKPYWMMIDSGGFMSLFRESIARELNLPVAPLKSLIKDLRLKNNFQLKDGSGTKVPDVTVVPTMEVGNMRTTDEQFSVIPDSEIDRIDGHSAERIAGTLGQNFLANYDAEFDLANKKFRLFLSDQCNETPVYWSQEYFEIPFRRIGVMPHVRVILNGKEIDAVLDTGSGGSYISSTKARMLFDIDPEEDPAAKTIEARFINSRTNAYPHKFDKLEIGAAAFPNPTIQITDLGAGTDFILGMDHLRQMRFYIANPRRPDFGSVHRTLSPVEIRKFMAGVPGIIYATLANATLPSASVAQAGHK